MFAPDTQSGTSVTSQPDGSFVAAWNSRDRAGSDSGVFGQRCDVLPVTMGAWSGAYSVPETYLWSTLETRVW